MNIEKHFPKYIKLWGNAIWLCIWSAPNKREGETFWQALRITIRQNEVHSKLLFVIKKGVV